MKILFPLLLCLWVLPAHSQPKPKTSPASTYVSPYTKETVFSVPLGNKKTEIGVFIPGPNMESYMPTGVRGLVIGPDGSFYLSDRVNKRIQIFDAKGKWKGQTQGQLAEHEGFAVSKTKHIFTLTNDGNLSCFSPTGRRLWRVSAEPKNLEGRVRSVLFPLSDGGVALQTWAKSPSLAVFDRNGKYQKTISGSVVSLSGKKYLFESQTKNGSLKYQALAAPSTDKELTPLFMLQPRPQDTFLFTGQAGFAPSLGKISIASNDTLFSVGYVLLPKKTPDILPGLHTVYDMKSVVVVYDSQGTPQPAVRFLTEAVEADKSNVCLDAQNNIYTFEYTPKTLNVVRYRLKKQP